MVRADILRSKLGELADRATRVRTHRRASSDELAKDRDALDLVSFNLLLAVQAAADIAAHLVADEGWGSADNVADLFSVLEAHGVLRPETCSALRRAAGLRNVVAHGYAGVDVPSIHAASHAGLDDLDAFARDVATWLSTRSA